MRKGSSIPGNDNEDEPDHGSFLTIGMIMVVLFGITLIFLAIVILHNAGQ